MNGSDSNRPGRSGTGALRNTAGRTVVAVMAMLSLLAFSSCESLKTFLSKDLEEEDFVIGQLYVDEQVRETPVIASPVPLAKPDDVRPTAPAGRNPLGLEYSPADNNALYETVNSWIGVPYKYGGNDRRGIDCSGFVGTVVKKVYGISMHRTSNEMLQDVVLVGKDDLQEGDILFFTNSKGKVSHVGIYLKDGLFAHASTTAGVCVSRTSDKYWSKHFYKGGRLSR